jgi:hypothetical protein
MEWLMTPPRSELWAALLGAVLALAWYLTRNGYHRALRTAAYTALGAGSGFALGNFFQTLGSSSGIAYNWWNVMEFTLGFLGGLGMAYAVLTRDWPESETPTRTGLWTAATIVFLFLPFSNLANSMSAERFLEKATRLSLAGAEAFATRQMWITGSLVILFAVALFAIWKKWGSDREKAGHIALPAAFFLVTFEYNLFSYIQLITFRQRLNFGHSETLYIFILAGLFLWWYPNRKKGSPLPEENGIPETGRRWLMILGSLALLLIAITLISVHSHGTLPGAHERF